MFWKKKVDGKDVLIAVLEIKVLDARTIDAVVELRLADDDRFNFNIKLDQLQTLMKHYLAGGFVINY